MYFCPRKGACLQLSGLDVLKDVQTKTYKDKSLNPKLEYIMHRYWSAIPLFEICPRIILGTYLVLHISKKIPLYRISKLFPSFLIETVNENVQENMNELILTRKFSGGANFDPVTETMRCSDKECGSSLACNQRLEFGNAFTNAWNSFTYKDMQAKKVIIDWTPSKNGGCYGGVKTARHHREIINFFFDTFHIFEMSTELPKEQIFVKSLTKIGPHFLCLYFEPLLDLCKYIELLEHILQNRY